MDKSSKNELYLKIFDMKWYEPDERWELFSINSREQFQEHYVVVGQFHDLVPEHIVTAFETVTYLMAHSYYHWPMQDEALSKALLIMEMAIKLKAKDLNIDFDKVLKNKRKQNKKLVELIDEVCALGQLDFLKLDFDRARSLRNSKMHPDRHSFMGGVANSSNIILFINIINQLFLDRNSIQKLLEKRKEITDNLEVFKNGNFVLENQNEGLLITGIIACKYSRNSTRELLLLHVNPLISNVYDNLTNNRIGRPLIIALKEFDIDETIIEGTNLNNTKVSIKKAINEKDILIFSDYKRELDRVPDFDKAMFKAKIEGSGAWEMERIVYDVN